MGLRATIKNQLQSHFNIPRWINYTHWRHFNHSLIASIKSLGVWQSPVQTSHSFEAVVQQLKLTETDLLEQQRSFLRLAQCCLSLFVAIVGYLIYLIVIRAWWGVIPSLVLAMMMLCQAFRYHFWYFQVKQRRLGCSFQEWYQAMVMKNEVRHD